MTRPILTTNDDVATIQVDVASARALGLTEEGIARLLLDARAAAEVLARATSTRWTVERVEPAEVTGETITDEQIRDLSERAGSLDGDGDFIRELCKRALAPKRYSSAESRRRARSRCADIINARFGARL